MPSVGDWISLLDEWFPPAWAEAWDNVGLQVGDRSWTADQALVALDPTLEVVAEAAAKSCGLVVTHHPLLFRPLSRLDMTDPVSRTAAAALSAPAAIVACHTNADAAKPGVNDALAAALDLEVTGTLKLTTAEDVMKLVVFVPAEATAKVLDAVAGAGAGVIGEYDHCSFRVRGSGTFRPSPRANPAVGERGEINTVEEDRLEMVVPRPRLEASVEAMLDAHPYEEVAYDLYPLAGGTGMGIGRLTRPREPLRTGDLAERCRDRLGVDVRVAGDRNRDVRTAAICGGSGASYIPAAVAAGVDAYVTGDVKHHDALDAIAAGLFVIDAGHHGTEWPFVPHLADRLREAGPGEVLVSETPTDPFAAP
ncbi:MAG: Nif3-like dinuclear metal center hexameric protein [Actinomycetota bacterium]|nr:Nif3-like dinuclear metal center hexameric protein [Actinomycetota bacterium]